MLLELVSDEIDHWNLVANPRFAKGLLNHRAKHRSDQAQPIFKNRCPNSKEVSQSFLKSKLSDLTLHSQTSQFTKKNSTNQKKERVKSVYLPSLLFHDCDGLCDCLSFILPHLAALLEVAVTGVAIGLQFRQVGACNQPTSEMVMTVMRHETTGSHPLWDVLGRTWKWLMLIWGIRNSPRIYSEQQDLNTAVLSKLRTTAVLSKELSSLRVFLVCRSNCFTSASSPFSVAAVVSAAVMASVFSEIAWLREVSNSEQAWKHSEAEVCTVSFDTQSARNVIFKIPTVHQSPISASYLLGLLPLLLTLASLIPELFQEILQGRHYTSRLEGVVLLVVLSTRLARRNFGHICRFKTIENHLILATFIFTKCLLLLNAF